MRGPAVCLEADARHQERAHMGDNVAASVFRHVANRIEIRRWCR